MLHRIAPIIIVLAALAWPGLPQAQGVDCMRRVEAIEKVLRELEGRADSAREPNQPRIRAFLADARRLLADGRNQCSGAETSLAKTSALATVALAQGNLAAARILIVLE